MKQFLNVSVAHGRSLLRTALVSGWLVAVGLTGCGGGATTSAANESALNPGPAPATVVVPVGFYAMSGLTMPASEKTALLALPHVSGMTSYLSWKEFEPALGQWNFSRLDADLALVKSHGKKLTIGVFTGRDSLPDWIGAAGVRTWVNSQGTTLVHPTDPVFASLWRNRIAALGQRYGADSTVVQVTICGPTGSLCGPRYPELPAGVNYAEVVAAWAPVIAAYHSAFPQTYKNLEVQLSTNGWGANLPVDLLAGVAPDVKIGPFAEFLSDVAPADGSITAVAFAATAKGRSGCGFQMVSPLADKIGQAVSRGRAFGCRYFEIYGADLKSQDGVLGALAAGL